MSESIVDVINRRFTSGNSVSVERVHINLNEWNALRQHAEQSCRDRIKADRLYCMKHGDEFAREMAERLERAEGRGAELEKGVDDGSDAWLLRKQAEAVDRIPALLCVADSAKHLSDLSKDYAQRLRTQADELEKE